MDLRLLTDVLLLPAALALVEPVPPPASGDTPEERWLNIPLNNFQGHNTDTFPMRYYYNGGYGGPHVVVFVGGAWPISPGWTQAGLAYELASLVGAGLFYTEHRYYGRTHPLQDTSLDNLRYLNVDQALADLAHFIQAVRSPDYEYGMYQHGKVILVGCSYAGSMATWMRLAYPHLVDVVFSDSGPLHAQVDFPEYLEVVAEALHSQGGARCEAAVREGMEALRTLLRQPAGPAAVQDMFNLCGPISSALDEATFHWSGVTESFAALVRGAAPGDIPAACATLTDSTLTDPVARLARWVRAQPNAQPCLEGRYAQMVTEHTDTSLDAPKTTMRLWMFQSCAEFGWFQTTQGARHPFLDAVPQSYFHQMCRDLFSSQLNENFVYNGVSRTNRLFGGLSHIPDHVVSVQGGHDPWSPKGPNEANSSHLSPVYVVPGLSHCRAISGRGTTDIPELEATKIKVLSYLYERVTGQPLYASDASRSFASIALVALFALLLV